MAVLPPPITIIAETPPKALAGMACGRAWCRRPVTVRELGWPANLQLSKFHNGGQMTEANTNSTKRGKDAFGLIALIFGCLMTLGWTAFLVWLALKAYSLL
ncbi:hypothetical protein SAMN05519103_09402 [Rhizobiales bacterium GAS113]|nr:hypothetical protein SAMN05519103_09402 [Rhizobiales bacterium GAS113]